jgi:hypothetical protein
MDYYRLSSLFRAYDLSLGTNRGILLLSAAGAAVGAVLGLVAGQPPAAWLMKALLGGATPFAAAALAKEIDPDHPGSAVLAAALAVPVVGVTRPESLPALLWLLIALRFINRSTGLAPKVTDTLALLLLTGWLVWYGGPLLAGLRFASPLYGVLAGAVLFIDALLPGGRRAHGVLGGLVGGGAVVYWIANAGRFPPQPHETWLGIALLAVAMGMTGVILTCYVILMPGDATGRPLDSARFQAAQIVALAAGLSFASWHGHDGTALFVGLWTALIGAVIMYWVHAGERRTPTTS